MATQILLKLNQYSSSSIQSLPSPNDWFNNILTQLNQWLSIIPNFFHSLFTKLGEIFSGENLAHWLAVAQPYLLVGLGFVLLGLFCFCILPAILSCIVWILVAIWTLIVGFFLFVWSLIRGFFMLFWTLIRRFFMLLWKICRSVFQMCLGCCRGFGKMKMMKAPGTGGTVLIPRAAFEANPRAYFLNLRGGGSVNSYSLLR